MIEIRTRPDMRRGLGEHAEQAAPKLIVALELDALAGADLTGLELGFADLRGADLRGSDLSGARLMGADLRDADLGGARLHGAWLFGAQFAGAELDDADFTCAKLMGACLNGADLTGALLADAKDLDSAHYDEATVWPAGMAPPTAPERTVANVRKLMGQAASPEEWSARHGRHTLVFGYDYDHFADRAMQAWVRRVGEIIRNDAALREMEERYLTPEEVASIRESAEHTLDGVPEPSK